MADFKATVITDSVSPAKHRLLTMEVYAPRIILAEINTHRMLSKNSASSRARPVNAVIEQVRDDPFLPVRWGLAGRGMQDHGEMTPEGAAAATQWWLQTRDVVLAQVAKAEKTLQEKPHKQIINRVLEPWVMQHTLLTATEWANLFALRRHKDAQPEFRHLANLMWDAMKASKPRLLTPGQWHLPYLQQHELDAVRMINDPSAQSEKLRQAIQVSAARCARLSYRNRAGKVTRWEEDLELYQGLVGGPIKHASPVEHQATPDVLRKTMVTTATGLTIERKWDAPQHHGNLTGWVQFRKLIPGENITNYNPEGEA